MCRASVETSPRVRDGLARRDGQRHLAVVDELPLRVLLVQAEAHLRATLETRQREVVAHALAG